jgi:tetratricopeptide (TPR) repeat protein
LHGNVGKRLEIAYSTRAREIAPQLADHLVRAGEVARAVVALRLAAEQAFERLAHREALDHLTTGLEMLERVDEGEQRWAAEFALQSMLGAALIATRGWSDPGAESAFLRARELADRIGQDDELGRTLFQLGTLYEVRGDYERADPLLHESLAVSGRTLNSGACTDSNELLACSLFHQGSFTQALEHAERGLAAYDGQYVNPLTAAYGDNAGASCHSWAALSLWFLGYPDQAGERARQAVETTSDPRRRCGRATALVQAAIVDQCVGDAQATWPEQRQRPGRNRELHHRAAMATILRGWHRCCGPPRRGRRRAESALASRRRPARARTTPTRALGGRLRAAGTRLAGSARRCPDAAPTPAVLLRAGDTPTRGEVALAIAHWLHSSARVLHSRAGTRLEPGRQAAGAARRSQRSTAPRQPGTQRPGPRDHRNGVLRVHRGLQHARPTRRPQLPSASTAAR